jgi:hypothetical protein
VDPVRSPSDTKKTNSTAASPNGRNKFITHETLSYYCNEAKREHRGVVVAITFAWHDGHKKYTNYYTCLFYRECKNCPTTTTSDNNNKKSNTPKIPA